MPVCERCLQGGGAATRGWRWRKTCGGVPRISGGITRPPTAIMRITDRFFSPISRPQTVFNASRHIDALPLPAAALPPVIGEMWAEERTRIAVSRNSNISGKLSYQGPVRIDGRLRGEVTST